MPVAPIRSFPIPVAVDLDFRPDTYVADWCALAAIVQNVTGERRRHEAHTRWLNRARAGGLMPRHAADTLEPPERDAYVAEDPVQRAPGEWLPPYLRGELEIARLVVATTPQLVYSLRARPHRPRRPRTQTGDGAARTLHEQRTLRLVNDQGTRCTLPTPHRTGTLSLRELIQCIDGARASHLPDLPRELPFPESLVLEATQCGIDSARLPDLVQVSSVVYPELHAFYRARLHWWAAFRFRATPPSRRTERSLPRTLAAWWAAGEDRA